LHGIELLTQMLKLTVLTVAVLVSGCSWQQAYQSTQGWQRNQCNRLADQTERERCLGSAATAMSYNEYQRQTEGARKN